LARAFEGRRHWKRFREAIHVFHLVFAKAAGDDIYNHQMIQQSLEEKRETLQEELRMTRQSKETLLNLILDARAKVASLDTMENQAQFLLMNNIIE
jgi:uncharacterized protein YlxW (UPF0749 family)